MSKFLTKTFSDFLSEEEVSLILNYAKKTESWRKIPGNFWDSRTINLSAIEDKNIFDLIEKTIFRIQETMVKEYDIPSKPYADTMDLVRWFSGMEQAPHCDDMSDNETEKNKFSHRYFGSVICLNDNYSGGRTYYPEHNFEVVPKSGTLVIHLGDCDHRHGVTKVEGETRYTLASFWSLDKNRALGCVNWGS